MSLFDPKEAYLKIGKEGGGLEGGRKPLLPPYLPIVWLGAKAEIQDETERRERERERESRVQIYGVDLPPPH